MLTLFLNRCYHRKLSNMTMLFPVSLLTFCTPLIAQMTIAACLIISYLAAPNRTGWIISRNTYIQCFCVTFITIIKSQVSWTRTLWGINFPHFILTLPGPHLKYNIDSLSIHVGILFETMDKIYYDVAQYIPHCFWALGKYKAALFPPPAC